MSKKKKDGATKKTVRRARAKPAAHVKPVDALKHTTDKRTNIPTCETAALVTDDEAAPKTVHYPRDPSLDPQLVWKGKDAQDAKPLEVPAVPIYIQEKIQPQAIIEDLRQRAAKGKSKQLDLFADFNGIDDFEKRVDFYHHDQHWSNRMILGDSLFVMTSLAEKERLKGQVQMIYVDPPYGIKFGSNWQVSTRKRDVKDAKAEDVTRQPEQIKAFRDTWQLGIHSYLSWLRDLLTAARDLLTESGSIFVQIGDENVHLVRCLMDEVFGSDNFVSLISFATTSGFESGALARGGDYLLWYARNEDAGKKVRTLYEETKKKPGDGGYRWVMFPDGSYRGLTAKELRGEEPISVETQLYSPDNMISQGAASVDQTFEFKGKKYHPGPNSHWKAQFPDGMDRLGFAGRLHVSKNSLRFIRYADDFGWRAFNNIWTDTLTGQFTEDKLYVVQTNTKVVERCLLMTTDPGDLVLDPTCGSGTTAYVAEQWGRRWITIDTSRVALALARTRLMSARFPYYLLSDSPEGRRKEAEPTGQPAPDTLTGGDIRKGFVYKRVPHVTLKSIANNPDIKEGMTREQIDAAIRKHADTETLYDQPYEDNGIVRVTGPFTVESLSPHRMLPLDESDSESAPPASEAIAEDSANYLTTILDNLRKAGVQNTVKKERLVFERLDAFPGEYIHAEGTFAESGTSKGVRVSIGPEFGTVDPEWIKRAALEAIKGSACDLLLVCGFAFDPHVSEQTKELTKEMRFGKLRILSVKMNPDLSMGDVLLKKTGSGNLFMVFGEPDISLHKEKGGRLVIELRGVDVYDPTTGEVRSHRTNDIACWFIDTDYNDESFFVRHAYFCGADEPYEKLKKALRAEIDEAEWSKLYSTRSLPFEAPKKGKIAVKVINHYGDELLKVFRAP
jgi:adenine-specific DNA-methyltransferase